jgi:hypothetical protein
MKTNGGQKMVDIINETRKLLKEFGYKDTDVLFIKKRYRFADAAINEETNRLRLFANIPSLVRTGLAYIIAHEISHLEYREQYGYNPDEDYDHKFKKIERKNIEKFWELCRKEHDK